MTTTRRPPAAPRPSGPRSRAALAAGLLAALPAAAWAQPVNRAALQAQRDRLTQQVARSPASLRLCTLGDVERQLGALDAAAGHYREGIQRLPASGAAPDALAARRVEFMCRHGLARALDAASPRDAAAELERAWATARGVTLPADFRAWSAGLFRRALAGADCVAPRDDDARAAVTELSVLRALADGDDPGLRACLATVRARLARARIGRATPTAPPTPIFTQGAEGWTAIDAQTGWRVGDAGVIVARVEGREGRYVTLDGTVGEGGTQVTARWVTLGERRFLAVVLAVTVSGEDLGPRERPIVDRTVDLLDERLALAGSYAFAWGEASSRNPAHATLPAVTGPWPLRADGETLVLGRTRLAYRDGAFVAAPPAAPARPPAPPAR